MWILGNSFLRGFYSTHDMRRNKFGFAVHSNSTKNHPRYGVPASSHMPKLVKHKQENNQDGKKNRRTIIILISCLVGVVAAGVILYFILKRDPHQNTKPLAAIVPKEQQ